MGDSEHCPKLVLIIMVPLTGLSIVMWLILIYYMGNPSSSFIKISLDVLSMHAMLDYQDRFTFL